LKDFLNKTAAFVAGFADGWLLMIFDLLIAQMAA